MTDTELTIDELRLQAAPGIDSTLTLEGLSDGVNIVHGPNGAGKSTLGQAIITSLWPAREPEMELQSWFTIGGDDWLVESNRGAATYQRNTASADPPDIPAREHADRYELALDRLIEQGPEASTSFAEIIQRESQGGVDLDAAHERLGFDDSPSTRGIKEYSQAEEARKRLRDAETDDEEVKQNQRKLPELQSKLEDAEAAKARVEALQSAIDYYDAKQDLHDAKAAQASYPDELAELDGNEADEAANLAKQIEACNERISEAERKLADAKETLRTVSLPDEGIPTGTIEELREHREEVAELETKHDDLAEQLKSVRAEREEERARLPFEIEAETLESIDPAEWSSVQDFLADVDKHTADTRSQEVADDWVTSQESVDEDLQTIQRGQQELKKWLESPSANQQPSNSADLGITAVSAGALILGGILGTTINLLLFGLVILGAIVLAYAYVANKSETTDTNQKAASREEYQGLGLEPISEWSDQAVKNRLDDLYEREATSRLQTERRNQRARVAPDVDDLERQAEQLDLTREQLREAHGIDIAPDSDLELADLIDSVRRWKDAHARVIEKTAAREERVTQLERKLSVLTEKLAPYGYETVTDAAMAKRDIEDLRDRKEQHSTAMDQREEATGKLINEHRERSRLTTKRTNIFTAIGLTPDQTDQLATWCEKVEEYEEAVRDVEVAEDSVEGAKIDLENNSAATAEMHELSREELVERKTEAQEQAEEHRNIQQKIAEIKAEIEHAKESNNVANAHKAKEEAFENLYEQFDADVDAVVGDLLVERLREATQTTDRPEVFKSAGDRLEQITAHRYTLAFDSGTFRVEDTAKRKGLSLAELSTGTQLQVLLAVRLAFVEQREQGMKLPIVLDETLATSDDQRASKVIQSLLRLAEDGRQLFYFTAQRDEVGKWKDALNDADDIGYSVVQLESLDTHDSDPSIPETSIPTTDRPELPDPASHDHESFGEALDISSFAPQRGAGATHIWYIVEDVELLAELLADGIDTWGQLDQLLSSVGSESLHADPTTVDRVRHNGQALEMLIDCWQTGRGTPVNRAALEATSAVTDNFIDEVTELAEGVNGNAAKILQRLRDGKISGFRRNKIEELEEYFRDNGYITDEVTLPSEQIRARMRQGLKQAGLSSDEAQERVDVMLDRLDHVHDDRRVGSMAE